LNFPDEGKFLIEGTLNIFNCIWSITGNSSFNNKIHFEIDGGKFECNNLIINPFNKPSFQLIGYNSTNTTGSINCIKLEILEAITTGDHIIHLENINTNLTNSVCLFFDYLYLCI
jgi:hypothetical protein